MKQSVIEPVHLNPTHFFDIYFTNSNMIFMHELV